VTEQHYLVVIGVLVATNAATVYYLLKMRGLTLTRLFSREAKLPRGRFLRLLPADQLAELRKLAVQTTLEAGQTLFKEGEKGDSFFVITKGMVRIVKTVNNKKETLADFRSGDVIGEGAYLSGQPRMAAAVAQARRTQVLKIERAALEAADKEGRINAALWLSYTWNNFDNYIRSKPEWAGALTLPARQGWFAQHISHNLAMGGKVTPPAGCAYIFVVTGKVKIGPTSHMAPALVLCEPGVPVVAERTSRAVFLPELPVGTKLAS
jgi:CRP-like cAMP-binding protein